MRDADPSPPPTHFAATARRELRVFGAPVELALLPGRAARPGRPGAERPAFRPDLGLRIAATEAIHAGPEFVVTPNKFPFARAQTVLWSRRPLREPDAEFLHSALSWTDQRGGSLLLNSVGAAASIPRAHAHHTDEAMPFLPALGEQPFAAPWLPEVAGASYVQKAAPFALLGVRGDARARAEATAALQMLRMTPAVSLVACPGEIWICPRAVETPAPHFPYALGAAELWGRWCYLEEGPFRTATAADLERALVEACCSPLGAG